MIDKPLRVELFTIPQAACGSSNVSWVQAAQMVSRQLQTKFGPAVEFVHIEFMSNHWFDSINAQQLLEKGDVTFPFVLVDGTVACADKKINVSKINRIVQSKLGQ